MEGKAKALMAIAALALALLVASSGCVGQKSPGELHAQLVEIDSRNLQGREYLAALSGLEAEARKSSSQKDYGAIGRLVEMRIHLEAMKEGTINAGNELDRIDPKKIDCTSTGPILSAAGYYSKAIEEAGLGLEAWKSARAINPELAEKDGHFIEGLEDTISQLEFLKGELEKACNIAYLGK